jgi:hypothetical protein
MKFLHQKHEDCILVAICQLSGQNYNHWAPKFWDEVGDDSTWNDVYKFFSRRRWPKVHETMHILQETPTYHRDTDVIITSERGILFVREGYSAHAMAYEYGYVMDCRNIATGLLNKPESYLKRMRRYRNPVYFYHYMPWE